MGNVCTCVKEHPAAPPAKPANKDGKKERKSVEFAEPEQPQEGQGDGEGGGDDVAGSGTAENTKKEEPAVTDTSAKDEPQPSHTGTVSGNTSEGGKGAEPPEPASGQPVAGMSAAQKAEDAPSDVAGDVAVAENVAGSVEGDKGPVAGVFGVPAGGSPVPTPVIANTEATPVIANTEATPTNGTDESKSETIQKIETISATDKVVEDVPTAEVNTADIVNVDDSGPVAGVIRAEVVGDNEELIAGNDTKPTVEPPPQDVAGKEPRSDNDSVPQPEVEAVIELDPKAEITEVAPSEPASVPEPEVEQEVVPEPVAEPEAVSEPEPAVTDPEPEAVLEPVPEPEQPIAGVSKPAVPEPVPEPEVEQKEPLAEPEAVPEPETVPEPEPELEAVPEPEPEPEAEPEAVPEPEVEPEPIQEPEREPETIPKTEPEAVTEPKEQPEPSPETEPEVEPEVESAPKSPQPMEIEVVVEEDVPPEETGTSKPDDMELEDTSEQDLQTGNVPEPVAISAELEHEPIVTPESHVEIDSEPKSPQMKIPEYIPESITSETSTSALDARKSPSPALEHDSNAAEVEDESNQKQPSAETFAEDEGDAAVSSQVPESEESANQEVIVS